MKVATLGDKSNPAILMVPGMFCTSDMPAIVARHLEDGFFLVIPTLDGHHAEEPVYRSKEDDAREILAWLHAHDVRWLALLQGTSMGAEVALEVARQADLPIDRCLFDGGPFFHFPRFFRSIMARKFMRFLDMVRGKDADEAFEALMQSRFVKRLGGGSLESYRGLMGGFCEVSRWLDKASVRRIADTCYKCDLPPFDAGRQQTFTFLYSEDEPARKSEKRLRKAYPKASYKVMQGFGHGGFQSEEPERYAALMRELAGGSGSSA